MPTTFHWKPMASGASLGSLLGLAVSYWVFMDTSYQGTKPAATFLPTLLLIVSGFSLAGALYGCCNPRECRGCGGGPEETELAPGVVITPPTPRDERTETEPLLGSLNADPRTIIPTPSS